MKPYGREKTIKGGNSWKIDYHVRPKKKWVNWWENICDPFSRSRIKQNINKEINNEINNINGIL